MMQQSLLILLVVPAMEDTLIDVLLAEPHISGFTSTKASGHGVKSSALSMVEQVAGRQNRVQFLIEAKTEDLQGLIANLKQRFANSDLHYILLPVIESGRI